MKKIIIILSFISVVLFFYIKIFNNPKIIIPELKVISDKDSDGIPDNLDIVEGARKEVKNKTEYKSAYYSGGFPPKNEGVCTDVIWRAFKNAGYDLKTMIDDDIKKHLSKYPRVAGKPDPNIDFRRVPNLQVYLETHATKLTTKVIPGNIENLVEWQPGDIVIFGNHGNNRVKKQTKALDHIAIISNKRNRDGVPYIIHNSAPFPKENDWLIYWSENASKIIGHYRLKY